MMTGYEISMIILQVVTIGVIAWYAWEARRSASAMEDSVEITKDQHSPDVYAYTYEDDRNAWWLKVVNKGSRSARNIRVHFTPPSLKFHQDELDGKEPKPIDILKVPLLPPDESRKVKIYHTVGHDNFDSDPPFIVESYIEYASEGGRSHKTDLFPVTTPYGTKTDHGI
jgi:hypothetical protein